MTDWAQPEYTAVAELRGPLLVVRGVAGVGWDEFATIRLESGQVRHGLVLEALDDLAVVQVLEGTTGMGLSGNRVEFSGSPLRIGVGDGWLGRVCDGLGEPVDGGPPVTGEVTAPVAGYPINPAAREPPAEPVLTGVSVIDALTTLVRGQKLPIFSVAGLPHLELAGQLAAQASAGGEPFSVVFAAMGLTHADAAAIRGTLEERSAAGELVLLLNLADAPVIERLLTPRLALTVAEHLAFDARTPRARGDGRHDQLLRGAAGGVGGARRDPGTACLPRIPLQRPGLAVRAVRADPRAARLAHPGAGADHARRRHHPPGP